MDWFLYDMDLCHDNIVWNRSSFTQIRLILEAKLTDHFLQGRSSRLQMFSKHMFLRILQYSQENTCAGISF